jgi:hypothetical protein
MGTGICIRTSAAVGLQSSRRGDPIGTKMSAEVIPEGASLLGSANQILLRHVATHEQSTWKVTDISS